ncbi:periplasmic chaperone for outer membrane proteins Skp [Yoonia maricola]|uniref:Periplasmic chaperone for outer membrane proteins Skp n=1 Tax=Yoonia maricola TaxID=420999 RepID=A0A2M8WLZ6_9RHOB|nr:OmpH family outer membrane protein [Yoonia maricola]PJI91948.1 periplasmic chaperone for outer membrane proteins Skp [Yoonia maricola]
MAFLRACLIWLILALPASAQQTSPPVLIIDSERLFIETLYGQRLASELAQQASELQAENDRIVESLTLEERSLTVRRPNMTAEEFRTEAEAFDDKVQEVRRVRDAKNVELQLASAGARTEFEQRVQGIVANIMIERDAALVLEQRNVVLSVRAANITDDAIVRIDAELGDGSQ